MDGSAELGIFALVESFSLSTPTRSEREMEMYCKTKRRKERKKEGRNGLLPWKKTRCISGRIAVTTNKSRNVIATKKKKT
jgi:hypothetical protein